MHKKLLMNVTLGALLAACSQIPKGAYYDRGDPAGLLDKASEAVNLNIESPASVEEITNWINRDQPTRAELSCSEIDDSLCAEVKSVLGQFRVPVKYVPSDKNAVVLIYDRIQARDCENRYIDNIVNPYNLNYPTFGCTTAANMVQMVSDKKQFTDPALLDEEDAVKASQAANFYARPDDFTAPRLDSNFQPIATQSSLQTQGLSGGSR